MKPKFVIAAPPYSHQSGGIMVLHQLCDALNGLGYETAIAFFHSGVAPNFQWAFTNIPTCYGPNLRRKMLPLDDADGTLKAMLENGVVVYPDLIVGNPLGAKNVVRYLLYKNFEYSGLESGEFVLSFSKLYHSKADAYLFHPFRDPNLHAVGAAHWSERTMDCTYFGKGPNFTTCSRIPDTVVISRTWPEDKNQLGILLRQCRYFFTWDGATATNLDAIACGAVPVLLHEEQISAAEYALGEFGPLPRATLLDALNKESVAADKNEVDTTMSEIVSRMASYERDWQANVNAFAIAAGRFFDLT